MGMSNRKPDDWQLIKVTLGGYTQRHEITLVGEQPLRVGCGYGG
jgi:hypothetical protein